MTKLKTYVLAYYAQKPDPEWLAYANETGCMNLAAAHRHAEGTEATSNLHLAHRLLADATIAASAEAAVATGLERLRQRCPAAEGWINHTVGVSEVERGFIDQAVSLTAADTTEGPTTAADEPWIC